MKTGGWPRGISLMFILNYFSQHSKTLILRSIRIQFNEWVFSSVTSYLSEYCRSFAPT